MEFVRPNQALLDSKENQGLASGTKKYMLNPTVPAWELVILHPSFIPEADDDATRVVDSHFRVNGIESLRIADMSVTPFLLSCHLQAPAYCIGASCAERLVEQYSL
jgi:hypothetical protein